MTNTEATRIDILHELRTTLVARREANLGPGYMALRAELTARIAKIDATLATMGG